jgi:hypothetical protein
VVFGWDDFEELAKSLFPEGTVVYFDPNAGSVFLSFFKNL